MWIFVILSMITSIANADKRIVISIDGTNNDPNDGFDEYKDSEILSDRSISNVLKLHLLLRGNLDNDIQESADQYSFYSVGVGNRGDTNVYKAASAMFAITEPNKILDEVFQDLNSFYEPGDSIYIFGFSRGAAIARQLAKQIELGLQGKTPQPALKDVKIRFLGLWDTVAAFKGELSFNKLPSTTELGEDDGRIAANIEQAYHLVSIDDPRRAFKPTLMGHEDRVKEIWFTGVHSDIGGGYEKDGLSDITLEFMLNKARLAGLKFIEPETVNPNQYNELISNSRLNINPDPLGVIHTENIKDDKLLLAKFGGIFDERDIYVARNNSKTNEKPIIHHTVIERIIHDEDYQPRKLIALNNQFFVYTPNDELIEAENYEE